jgi:bifunctional DNA-binding transcriptional regulator/antitoxin component of YhaV-PrlF toxin-antitoxin module
MVSLITVMNVVNQNQGTMPKIYESPDGGKTIREREFNTPLAQQEYTKAKIHANSPYNDGWTRQHYQDIVDKYELGWQNVSETQFDDALKEPKRWTLTVEETKIDETDETDYFITFPEDLLEAAGLKEGDLIEWVDQGDGSFILKKVEDIPLPTYNDMIAAGYIMTDDGFWIKEG